MFLLFFFIVLLLGCCANSMCNDDTDEVVLFVLFICLISCDEPTKGLPPHSFLTGLQSTHYVRPPVPPVKWPWRHSQGHKWSLVSTTAHFQLLSGSPLCSALVVSLLWPARFFVQLYFRREFIKSERLLFITWSPSVSFAFRSKQPRIDLLGKSDYFDMMLVNSVSNLNSYIFAWPELIFIIITNVKRFFDLLECN